MPSAYLASVTFCTNAVLVIPEITGCHRRMMANLLRDHLGLVFRWTAIADKDLSQDGIERFLDTILRVASSILLPLQAR